MRLREKERRFHGPLAALALVADSPQGRAAFYVDGREVTAQAGLRHDFKLTGPLLIGRRTKGGPLPFDGQLDALRLYARALTPAEIAAISEGKWNSF